MMKKKIKKYADGGFTAYPGPPVIGYGGVRPGINPGGKLMPSQANVPTLPSQASAQAQGIMAARRPTPIPSISSQPVNLSLAPLEQQAVAATPPVGYSSDMAKTSSFGDVPAGITPITSPGPMKKGGAVKTKKMASGGKVSSASKRGDGCAQRGKTKGRMV